MKKALILLFFCLNISVFGQENNRASITYEQAVLLLQESLSSDSLHNVVGNILLLQEENQAVAFAEMILFDMYGKKNIIKQQPYSIHYIDNYWVISGSMPKGKKGGTFLLIFDSRNCEIIRITHGK